jgi:hypothetical protein
MMFFLQRCYLLLGSIIHRIFNLGILQFLFGSWTRTDAGKSHSHGMENLDLQRSLHPHQTLTLSHGLLVRQLIITDIEDSLR